MIVRKYYAFVSSTVPCVGICILSWWIDRLLAEMGHRVSGVLLCTHNSLQYVQMHCYMTIVAVVCQSIWSVAVRKKQFVRESIILGIEQTPCAIHLYLLEIGICTAWTVVVACLIDISPWLCYDWFLENRAVIAAGAMASAIAMVHLEQYLYTWTLRRVVMATTFEI